MALSAEGDYHAAAKAWRKIIKKWPHHPVPYHNLAAALQRSDHFMAGATMFLKAMELQQEGSKDWASSAASDFDLLKTPDCDEAPKAEW